MLDEMNETFRVTLEDATNATFDDPDTMKVEDSAEITVTINGIIPTPPPVSFGTTVFREDAGQINVRVNFCFTDYSSDYWRLGGLKD